MFTNETLDSIDSIFRGEDITKEIYFVQGSKNYKFLKQYEFNVFQIHDILEVGMLNDINIFCIIHGNTKKIDKFKLILENYKVFFLLYDNIENYKITHQLYNKMLYNRVHSVHIRHGFPTPDISNISDWVQSEIEKLDSDEKNDREELKEPERYFASHFFSIIPEYKQSEALNLWVDYESDGFIAGCSDDIDELSNVIKRVISKNNYFSNQTDITEKDKRILAQSVMKIKLLTAKNKKQDLDILSSEKFTRIFKECKKKYLDIFDSKEEKICQGNEICLALGIGSDCLISLYEAGMPAIGQYDQKIEPVDEYGIFLNIEEWRFQRSDLFNSLIAYGRKDLTYLIYLISHESVTSVTKKLEYIIYENLLYNEKVKFTYEDIFSVTNDMIKDCCTEFDMNMRIKRYLDGHKVLKAHMDNIDPIKIYKEILEGESNDKKNIKNMTSKHIKNGLYIVDKIINKI